MTDQEVEAKFKALTRKYLTANQTRKILDELWIFEKVRDLSKLAGLMVIRHNSRMSSLASSPMKE